MPTVVELIQRKRDGGRLSPDEIRWMIDEYTGGLISDYQMSAMTMAVFLNGLDDGELTAWTEAMLESGEVLDLSHIDRPKVDKHSTGGVGDKVSIPLAPMVAACGVVVPMMSGRGLGHTGGTLDKLESIPGFTARLSPARFRDVLERCGLVLAGQSDTLAPADRKLYALRDATGTVESIPLIASSIMSKKLAEDLDALVLGVTFGSGAFLPERERATALAETMVSLGESHGVPTVALLTRMDAPLGREVGNASEIRESLAFLRGEAPDDLVEVTMALGVEMLIQGGVAADEAEARSSLEEAVRSGRAFEALARVVAAQGGDVAALEEPSMLPTAPHEHVVEATVAGRVTRCDARRVGLAAMRLGAGRERKEDTIDPGVGITVAAKPGETVGPGDPVLRLRYRDPARLEAALGLLEGSFEISDEAYTPPPMVVDRITS
ncbi:MAG: thymidine phosphorylase [Acidimicrobiia bacterium]|jgi:pyrimidine-nucleoside phosphorylase